MTSRKIAPRGIRNNNPLNIRIGNKWFGEVDNPTDHEFEQFKEMKYGVRAAFIILWKYLYRYRLKTVKEIVKRWAPASENNVESYVRTVIQSQGLKQNETLDFENYTQMRLLLRGMCLAENGQYIADSDIQEGYDLAVKTLT